MPTDPILTLADLNRSATFTHGKQSGTVIPQRAEAGSSRLHPRWFYAQFPAKDSAPFHQIDASRLASALGDGSARKTFSARDVALMLSSCPSSMDVGALISSKGISF